MATLLQVVCDICPDHEKVPGTPELLGIDGRLYEADLCDADRQDLRKRLAPFLSLLRPVPKVTVSHKRKPPSSPPASNRQGFPRTGELPPFTCESCGGIYYGFQGIGAHKRTCTGPEEPTELHCADCKRNFANSMALITHRFEIHGEQAEGVFHCPECGRPYRNEAKLQRHLQDRHSLQGANA